MRKRYLGPSPMCSALLRRFYADLCREADDCRPLGEADRELARLAMEVSATHERLFGSAIFQQGRASIANPGGTARSG